MNTKKTEKSSKEVLTSGMVPLAIKYIWTAITVGSVLKPNTRQIGHKEQPSTAHLDDLLDEPAPPPSDSQLIPGIIDCLIAGDQDKLLSQLTAAPRYYTKQLIELTGQSKELVALRKELETMDLDDLSMGASWFNRLMAYFVGFREDSSLKEPISLPVLDMTFPTKTCSVAFEALTEEKLDANFRIVIPGIAGGAGTKGISSFTYTVPDFQADFQAHVPAELRLRVFTKGNEKLVVPDVRQLSSCSFIVEKGTDEYWVLPKLQQPAYIQPLGAKVPANGPIGGDIKLLTGSWAEFSASLKDIVSMLPNSAMKVSVRSECVSSVTIKFKSPPRKLYKLFGEARANSLRLLVEPEQASRRKTGARNSRRKAAAKTKKIR